jgi:hypothetical protein
MWSVEVRVPDAYKFLRDDVGRELDLSGFTACGLDDLDIRAVNERDRAGAVTSHLEWEALSPRGAVFLGELASVGFFGAEAQQLLAVAAIRL